MRSGKSSTTAQFVAWFRALGTLAPVVPGFSDPFAERFLAPPWNRHVARARRRLASRAGRSPYPLPVRERGIFHQFRTVVLDRAIASAAPVDQLVILGAGLDSRAWRLEALSEATVFEVDHPATQAFKRAVSAGLQPKAAELRFVVTDFREGALATALHDAGFDPGRRTFWLWEGVSMYLQPEEVARNLNCFTSLSARGSRLAMTYMNRRNGRTPRSLPLRLLGEPLRSAFPSAQLAEMLSARGWSQREDSGIEEWLAQMTPELALKSWKAGMQWHERIWHGDLMRL